MALQFEPGNGGGLIEQDFEARSPKDLPAFDLVARDPRLEDLVEDRFDILREKVERFVMPVAVPVTPAPTPTPIVMNLIAVPGPDIPSTIRQTLQSLLAPILGGGGVGGTGRALPLGTAGTRLVAAPARSPLVTLLVLAVIAGIGYYVYKRYKKGQQ